MIEQQMSVASRVKDFLTRSGLKARFVASQIGVDERTFSRFVHHKTILDNDRYGQLVDYIDNYQRRNGI